MLRVHGGSSLFYRAEVIGKSPSRRGKMPQYASSAGDERFSDVNWARCDRAIARDLGVSADLVRVRRQRFKAPEASIKEHLPRIDWTSVDWSLSNSEIARQHATWLTTVLTARKKYAPETIKTKC